MPEKSEHKFPGLFPVNTAKYTQLDSASLASPKYKHPPLSSAGTAQNSENRNKPIPRKRLSSGSTEPRASSTASYGLSAEAKGAARVLAFPWPRATVTTCPGGRPAQPECLCRLRAHTEASSALRSPRTVRAQMLAFAH